MILRRSWLRWEEDGADWPNRSHSAFVAAAGLTWHVQSLGEGPAMLLIHGTGASTHSWRDLMPALSGSFRVVAPDLPGHGFTELPAFYRLSLNGMAESLAGLLRTLDFAPRVVVGHSAGAAIAARLCLDGKMDPALLISLNGAWLPFPGSAGLLFPALAKTLFLNPLASRFFAAQAGKTAVERLIRQTGSSLDERGIELYQRLLRSSTHVSGALGMMAHWNLEPLARELPRLAPKLLLIAGETDRATPPEDAEKIRAKVPGAEVDCLAGLGHLAHEEAPDLVAERIVAAARVAGVLD
ncbi:MAG: alpha/beta fold hydrolase [Kiloniellales bacterium]|nr:alpha/beta fold hydrolase [Kiloniellales bacterium]